MKPIDFLSSLEPAGSWRDTLDLIRDQYGRGATRFIADRLGVTIRTAQRYMTGQHKPARHRVTERLGDVERVATRQATAAIIRDIRYFDSRGIEMTNRSSRPPEPIGTRDPGLQNVSGAMPRVADLWEAARFDEAADRFCDAVIAEYFGEPATSTEGAASQFGIDEFGDPYYEF